MLIKKQTCDILWIIDKNNEYSFIFSFLEVPNISWNWTIWIEKINHKFTLIYILKWKKCSRKYNLQVFSINVSYIWNMNILKSNASGVCLLGGCLMMLHYRGPFFQMWLQAGGDFPPIEFFNVFLIVQHTKHRHSTVRLERARRLSHHEAIVINQYHWQPEFQSACWKEEHFPIEVHVWKHWT